MRRRRDLLIKTMALTMSVLVSAVALSGCGGKEPVNPEAAVTEVDTEVTSAYSTEPVAKPYDAVSIAPVKLIEDLDTMKKGDTEYVEGEYFTVTAEVFDSDGVKLDYYRVELEDGSSGYLDGKDLSFDVAPLEDYADSLVEIEGGDGEEVSAEETTEVVEETPAEEVAEEPEEVFEPYFMFTNTGANVRAQASKESELVGTAPINTEVKVVGVEGDWSNVEFNGLSAYIKSSLLSKDKTEVASSNTGGSSGSGNTQADNGGNTAPAPSQPSQPAPSPGNGLPPLTGHTVEGGGTSGQTAVGMGECY